MALLLNHVRRARYPVLTLARCRSAAPSRYTTGVTGPTPDFPTPDWAKNVVTTVATLGKDVGNLGKDMANMGKDIYDRKFQYGQMILSAVLLNIASAYSAEFFFRDRAAFNVLSDKVTKIDSEVTETRAMLEKHIHSTSTMKVEVEYPKFAVCASAFAGSVVGCLLCFCFKK